MTYPCRYFSPTLEQSAVIDAPQLATTSERHKVTLTPPVLADNGPARSMPLDDVNGIVIEMWLGWPSRSQLALASAALKRSKRAWLYWPDDGIIECVDEERLPGLRRLWLFVTVMRAARRKTRALKIWLRQYRFVATILSIPHRRIVRALIDRVAPVPFADLPRDGRKISGTGLYLRTDFWAPITSGGSYGHTCYVAKELAAVTEDLLCLMANRFPLLDTFGLMQFELPSPGSDAEDVIIRASRHYLGIVRERVKGLKPAYIYERLALGSFVGAALSQELKIPYIVEYNGSEISMQRSFAGKGYLYERLYVLTEDLAFRQATFISVVSEEVKRTLVERGIPAKKILMNPNGADLTAYAPPSPSEKQSIRAEVGLPVDAQVVGFSGTFGGWHGVDVLAAAIPKICAQNPGISILLIGDGNFKQQVDDAVAAHGLGSRVVSTGRVPQSQGARLLKACDIFVSPHNSHMRDSRFFGSPTKIFEYMAMAGGIVASDLEQIGVVLSPALRMADLRRPGVQVTNERAVLCTPGAEDEFVEAVVRLASLPDVGKALGRNARTAVADSYSWRQHVSHLWTFAESQARTGRIWGPTLKLGAWMRMTTLREVLEPSPEAPPQHAPAAQVPVAERRVETGDLYKDEVQRQWDNDPAGSHYVKQAARHTLEWFLEAEAYRYRDYAPWMAETMEFATHRGDRVLEIGGGMGTDLAQFASHGAFVTDLDLSSGHLELARENFALRRLHGDFILHDAESLPFDAGTFDLVYSNGVLHHTPNTRDVVREIHRVLKPGGRVIIMMYAENSIHYWRNLVWSIGVKDEELERHSIGEIMSRAVERSDNAAARPLVKVYTRRRLRAMFDGFDDIEIVQRQMVHDEVPRLLSRVPVATLGTLMGWNLIVKARKPRTAVRSALEAAPAETARASARR
jgi:glycosyltransferase involved in cell wall biosynthesis/SAM-dependent methyltransferase